MNNSPTPPAATRSPVESHPPRRRFLRNLFRALLCLVVCLVTLVALLHAVENWRGKRAWAAHQKATEANGDVLDLLKLAPPPVPDDQNFAMTPFLAPLFEFKPGTQTYRDTNALTRLQKAFNKLPTEPRNAGDWRKGETTDLSAWLTRFQEQALDAAGKRTADTNPIPPLARPQAATALLAVLQEYDPILDELRAASRRPHSRFNIRYEEPDPSGILLPHLARLKALARILSLRASAELALDQAEPALNDLNLAFYLADSIRNEPVLISHLVRCAIVQLAVQPLWEGLANRRWTDAQLQSLEQGLRRFDFLADDLRALRGERAFGNSIIAYVRQNPQMVSQLGNVASGSDPPAFNLVVWLMPRGWFYLEQLNYDRAFVERLLPGVNPTARRVEPEVIARNAEALDKSLRAGVSAFTAHRILTGMLLPAVVNAHRKFAYVQVSIDQARIACALERHRLAHREFPESPAALAPGLLDRLPHDLISAEPLKYRRTASDGFVLYSVGWNQKDDGGETALSGTVKNREATRGREVIDTAQGDWVWRSR